MTDPELKELIASARSPNYSTDIRARARKLADALEAAMLERDLVKGQLAVVRQAMELVCSDRDRLVIALQKIKDYSDPASYEQKVAYAALAASEEKA